MKKSGLLLLFLMANMNFLFAQDAKQKIGEKLDKQMECWNKGDLECFMGTYWKSDSLMFIGKDGITYGWQNVLQNYRRNYPDRLSMGDLQMEILKMRPVAEGSYFVVGKWLVSRPAGDLKGHFSLIWEKIAGQWVIVADHSSGE